jgi:DNA-directed RNA polymerase subunit K
MTPKTQETFTKYEMARIIGARALQVAMDAPILLKLSQEELKAMRYDALLIAEREFKENVLPISISRPTPQKKKDKLAVIKEEKVSDEEIAEKEKEVEKEIVESAAELGFVKEDEVEGEASETAEE